MAISCEPNDLLYESRCFCISGGGKHGDFINGTVGAVIIYAAIAYANGGEAPQLGFVFGNPDEDWSFGDPDTGDEFGAPL